MGTKSKSIIGNRSDRIWNSNTGNSGVIIESNRVNHRDGFAFVAAGDGDIRSSALVTDYDDGSVVKYKFKIEKLLIGSVLSSVFDSWVAALNR